MSEIPPLPELRFIGVDSSRCGLEGRRISYLETGSTNRDTLVLLHGIGSNASGWRYVLAGLGARYRVIAWNAPGYLLSDNFVTEAPGNDQYADALAAFLEALAVERMTLVGSSFGSMIAATFAARHPRRLRRLALLGASRGQKWLSGAERARRRQVREESIRDGGLGLAETRWSALLSANPTPEAVRLTQELLKATNRRGFLQSVRASDTTDVLEFTNAITAATLVVVGKEDRVNPPEISRAIHAAISGSRLVELDGIGHLAKLEAPDRVMELLLAHIGDYP